MTGPRSPSPEVAVHRLELQLYPFSLAKFAAEPGTLEQQRSEHNRAHIVAWHTAAQPKIAHHFGVIVGIVDGR